jgi:hypothetical protein
MLGSATARGRDVMLQTELKRNDHNAPRRNSLPEALPRFEEPSKGRTQKN